MNIMFQHRFSDAVSSGAKENTIRPIRKGRPICKGDRVSLRKWDGLAYRSKQVVLREAVVSFICPVEIANDLVKLDGMYLGFSQMEWFARKDGFADWEAMRDWFSSTHALPFIGVFIYWGESTFSLPFGIATDGPSYLTRCGYPVRIYARDGGRSGKQIQGAVFTDCLGWHVFTWLPNGQAYSSDPVHDYDLRGQK